jgi:putative ATPase
MRPRRLDEFLGQEHILGMGKPLRESILRGDVSSIVFWGPPGCGKTTLARLIANHTDRHFELFSAVTAGVPQVREIVKQAQHRLEYESRGTILFCDEIHRFNKAQQDAFLPWVEQGVITLIGATTENPSFELTGALLSRVRVFVLEPLGEREIGAILGKALTVEEGTGREEGGERLLSADALVLLVTHADGDARRALNALEAIQLHVAANAPLFRLPLSLGDAEALLAKRLPTHDKSGESHYNIISALHKAVRGSDVDGALYWLARMIDAGDDPLYIARRVVRMASEDIGLADPRALSIAVAAKDAYHFLGSPEGELAVVEAVVYLATAPKSNRIYEAWDGALAAARAHPNEPVPMHIRNAPTRLMKDLGYGKGYRYDHAEGGAFAAGQEYLPEALQGLKWYEPTTRGFEKTVGERMEWWGRVRARVKRQDED